MRIAYDISLLGGGHISNQSRTGIFRVTEEIILELNQRENVSVYPLPFHRDATILDAIGSFLYCENEQPALLPKFRTTHYSRLNLTKAYTALIRFQKKMISSSQSRKSFRYKVGRALQVYGSQIAKRECSAVLHPSEYDVYHSSYFPLSDFKEFPNIPRVFTVYDLIPVLFPEFVVATVYQRTIDMLRSIDIKKDWIICISEQTKQDFCRYTGMNADRVFVTPLAAANHFMPVQNISYIRSVLEKCKIPNSPYILSLCTLEPRKNIIVLIRAFADLIQTHPEIDLNLVLVGINGWKNHEIFKTVQNTPLVKGRLFFTGYLSDDDLAPIYSGALAFVYPSLYEGFGLPPLEAMQCGTPIITSNNSSLPEVVADAGILINPQHQDELSHALWKLVNDTDLRSQLSQKSLLRSRQFSWSKCVDEIIEVYRTAVDNRD